MTKNTTVEANTFYNIEAEEWVCAAVIVDGDLYPKLAKIVQARDFYREKNRWIWETFSQILRRGDKINQITVAYTLSLDGMKLQAMGGHAYLSAIVSGLPTTVGSEWYAEIVGRCSRSRQLKDLGNLRPEEQDRKLAELRKSSKKGVIEL